ncbi:MAG: hypothetical protein ACRDNJ_06770, partial [Solirubrobacteraceae bacterium]
AVERLRAGDARAQEREDALVLAAVDPAQPYGAALPWPKRAGDVGGRRPARAAGAHVVLVGGEPIVYLERGGRALQTLVDSGDARLTVALEALAGHVRAGAIRRIALERIDGEPATGCALAPVLAELGFQEGPRRLTLSA